MAFDLPFPPFPWDSRDIPFIATPDDNNGYTVPSSQYFKKLVGEKYLWTPVSANDPMPTSDATSQAKLAEILAKISADPATQTTLKAILDKIIAAPATEAKQTALNALVGEVQASPTANTLLARLKSLEDKIDKITAGTTPAVTTLSGSKTAYKRQNAGVNYNNYMFVGENMTSYGIAGHIAWNCEFPKKMVIIKNTSTFEIKYGWCLYDRLDIGSDQLNGAELIMRSSELIPLPSSATGEISFDTLKYPAVGLSIYLLHVAGGAGTTGSAVVTFLGGA